MERKPSSSSNIRGVGYDPEKRVLEIEFQDGAVYQYSNVPPEAYDQFEQAGFRGGHFHRHVRGLFETKKLPRQEPLKEG